MCRGDSNTYIACVLMAMGKGRAGDGGRVRGALDIIVRDEHGHIMHYIMPRSAYALHACDVLRKRRILQYSWTTLASNQIVSKRVYHFGIYVQAA